MPCALIEPSQQSIEYLLVSQHKQARDEPAGGDDLLGINVLFLLFLGIYAPKLLRAFITSSPYLIVDSASSTTCLEY